jgi:hypothetical protein
VNETEWLISTDSREMPAHVQRYTGDRKQLLFACIWIVWLAETT